MDSPRDGLPAIGLLRDCHPLKEAAQPSECAFMSP